MFYRDGHQKTSPIFRRRLFLRTAVVSGEGFHTALYIKLSEFNMKIKINS